MSRQGLDPTLAPLQTPDPNADLRSVASMHCPCITKKEEVMLYPGADTGNFDLSMEFFNTSSVDFRGPYATEAFSGKEKTAIQVGEGACVGQPSCCFAAVGVGRFLW